MDRRNFWPNRSFISIDTETTGLDPVNDRIIQVGIAVFLRSQLVWKFNWYSNVRRPSAKEALEAHGIEDKWRWEHGISTSEIIHTLLPILNRCRESNSPILAFNAPFDLSFITNEMKRFKLNLNQDRLYVIDPLVIDRHYESKIPIFTKPYMRLGQMAARYGVSAPDHNALVDAICAGYVGIAQTTHHSALRTASPRDLHMRQIEWHSTFRAKVNAFAVKKKIEFNVPDWPWG